MFDTDDDRLCRFGELRARLLGLDDEIEKLLITAGRQV